MKHDKKTTNAIKGLARALRNLQTAGVKFQASNSVASELSIFLPSGLAHYSISPNKRRAKIAPGKCDWETLEEFSEWGRTLPTIDTD